MFGFIDLFWVLPSDADYRLHERVAWAMKLRIVTATRGDSAFLSAMLRSLEQAAPGAEHVMVCPTGRTASLNLPQHIRSIAESGVGLYAAIEQGLRESGREWDAFTWINDDDLLNAEGFAKLVAEFSRRPEIGLAYGRVALIDRRGRRVGGIPVARRVADLGALLSRGVIPLAQPGTVIRRSVWEKLGGFDLSYRSAGDLDFFVRALSVPTRFAFVDAEVASFRLHAGQLSKLRAEVESETARALETVATLPASRSALWRFRLGNGGVYLDRLRRYGFVSMRTVYDRTE